MLQIKTIIKNDPDEFDKAVNEASASGWELTKRISVVQDQRYLLPLFCAELERVIISEEERCCENCKHYRLEPHELPCRNCNDYILEGWEADE